MYDQKSLVDQLDVTTDLGGTLNYNHKNWVFNRLVRHTHVHVQTSYTLVLLIFLLKQHMIDTGLTLSLGTLEKV